MKEINAIIQTHMLSRVRDALQEMPHFPGMTVAKCRGMGRGRGQGGSFVASEDEIQYHDREHLTVICDDEQAEQVVQIIVTQAHTGNPGDGIVFVNDIASVTRIRTGQSGPDAV